MLKYLPLEELRGHSKTLLEVLKGKTYADLEHMVEQMHKEKAEDERTKKKHHGSRVCTDYM